MKRKTPSFVFMLDQMIRHGDLQSARREVRRMADRRANRESAIELATLARRTSLPEVAARLLHPVIRPRRPLSKPASPRERAEYAMALLRLGAAEEADSLLSEFSENAPPEVLFFRAASFISQWRYADALPVIEKYVQTVEDEYQKTVGLINLTAALVNTRAHDRAQATLEQVAKITTARHWHLLQGNAWELAAQNHVVQRQLTEAERCLSQAEKTLGHSGNLDGFFVQKWQAFVGCLRTQAAQPERAKLESVRREATRRRHWETVRDCDRFLAIAAGDEPLLTHLCFGTPFESFKRGLLSDFGRAVMLPDSYVWRLGEKPKPPAILDLCAPETVEASTLKRGQLAHRALIALTSDFYRPLRLASLHAALFPGECFNPVSSPGRVHQAVTRVRKRLSADKIPLALVGVDGAYCLAGAPGIDLKIPRATPEPKRLSWNLAHLARRWPRSPFSRREASAELRLSMSSVQRILDYAESEGAIERTGTSAATRYRFTGNVRPSKP